MPKQRAELGDDDFQLGFHPRARSILHTARLHFVSPKLALLYQLTKKEETRSHIRKQASLTV